MRSVFLIARRELSAYLRTMSGYVIIAATLFVDGLLFNALATEGVAKMSSAVLGDFFFYTSGCVMIAATLLSMRLVAEERQTGTITLLYSSPVRDGEIVLGKFLSAQVFLLILLAATFYMPALIMAYGKISMGHVASGYLGLFLLGSAILAIGTFGSSLVKSQVLAAIASFCMWISLLVIWKLARVTDRPLSSILDSLAIYPHMKPFGDGLVHLKHVIFFVLVTYVGLFAATRVLEARRWR